MVNNLTYLSNNKKNLTCIKYIMVRNLNINKNWFHNTIKPHYDIPIKTILEISNKPNIIQNKNTSRIT